MNLEIPNDISQKNIFEYQKDSNDNSIIYSCDMKRKLLGRKTKRNYSDITGIERTRCDICLEFEKYSENNLIECKKCGGICHKRCGENDLCFIDNLNSSETPQNQIKDEEWKCLHCRNLNSSALSYSHR